MLAMSHTSRAMTGTNESQSSWASSLERAATPDSYLDMLIKAHTESNSVISPYKQVKLKRASLQTRFGKRRQSKRTRDMSTTLHEIVRQHCHETTKRNLCGDTIARPATIDGSSDECRGGSSIKGGFGIDQRRKGKQGKTIFDTTFSKIPTKTPSISKLADHEEIHSMIQTTARLVASDDSVLLPEWYALQDMSLGQDTTNLVAEHPGKNLEDITDVSYYDPECRMLQTPEVDTHMLKDRQQLDEMPGMTATPSSIMKHQHRPDVALLPMTSDNESCYIRESAAELLIPACQKHTMSRKSSSSISEHSSASFSHISDQVSRVHEVLEDKREIPGSKNDTDVVGANLEAELYWQNIVFLPNDLSSVDEADSQDIESTNSSERNVPMMDQIHNQSIASHDTAVEGWSKGQMYQAIALHSPSQPIENCDATRYPSSPCTNTLELLQDLEQGLSLTQLIADKQPRPGTSPKRSRIPVISRSNLDMPLTQSPLESHEHSQNDPFGPHKIEGHQTRPRRGFQPRNGSVASLVGALEARHILSTPSLQGVALQCTPPRRIFSPSSRDKPSLTWSNPERTRWKGMGGASICMRNFSGASALVIETGET